MHAFCYATGLINFGDVVPKGALPIARGPDADLRRFVNNFARHGYKTKKDALGRPRKIPGTDCLLVPGLPEAPDQPAAVDKLMDWLKWIGPRAPRGVVVTIGGK